MNKKKAIKIAAATAMAASSFAAVAPFTTEAAVNLDATVNNAVSVALQAHQAYTVPAKSGKLVDWHTVQSKLNTAKATYNSAVATINKNAGSKKAYYLGKLASASKYMGYAQSYIIATDTAQKLHDQAKKVGGSTTVDAAKASYVGFPEAITAAQNKITSITADTVTKNLLVNLYFGYPKSLTKIVPAVIAANDSLKAAEEAVAKNDLTAAKTNLDAYNAQLVNFKDSGANVVNVVKTYQTTVQGKYDTANAVPAVTSVSAINAKQLVVTFNKAVDADSVITTPGTTDTLQAGVVAVTRTSSDAHAADVAGALTNYDASLSEDGKTLTITAPATKFFKGNYDVAVKGVKTADGVTTLENFYNKFTIADTTAPTVTGVVYKPASDKFEVTLSEPIDSLTGEVLRVNGAPVSFDALAPGAVTNKLTFSRGSVAFGTNATLYIAGLQDGAGNLLSTYNGSVNVAKDTTALSVTSITQVSNQVARVTFNKKLNTASDTKILSGAGTDGLVVTKPDGSVTTNYAIAQAAAAVNPDGNVYEITFNDATYTSSNTQNFTVTFTKDGFTDVTGNTNALYTSTVTLNKDVAAPTVTSTKLSNDGKKIEVTLSEAFNSATINNQLVKLRKDGAELQSGLAGAEKVTAALKAGTNNVIEITTTEAAALNGDGTLKAGSYQVRFETGAFKDNNGVNVAAVNAQTVNVAASPSNPLNVVLAQGAGNNTFTVTAPAGQTFTTASLTYTHFTVDGVYVSANSDITLDPTRTVITVKLPATDSSKISGSALFAVNGLTLESGSTLNNVTKTLAVTDNTAPTLLTAQLIGTNVIKLTFDENLGAFAPATADLLVDDLQISNGAVNYNGLVADAVIGSVNGKELVLTVTPGAGSNWATIVGSSTVTVKTLTGGSHDITDTNLVGAREVTVNLAK